MNTLQPGFADPVADSQRCFRAILDAMAKPGSLMRIGAALRPPRPLLPATAAVLLTLTDAETPVWLDEALASAYGWLTFHGGAPAAENPGAAMFVVTGTLPDLVSLPVGTHDDPETSATVIVQVQALGRGSDFLLDGPGLAAPTRLSVTGLPENFVAQWAANHALYPRGVDLILCTADSIAALPRGVRVSEG